MPIRLAETVPLGQLLGALAGALLVTRDANRNGSGTESTRKSRERAPMRGNPTRNSRRTAEAGLRLRATRKRPLSQERTGRSTVRGRVKPARPGREQR